MRVTVVGSSDAFNSAGRHHSCYLLDEAGDEPIMIDFGATALRAVQQAGRDPRDIGAIVFTHLHGDHTGGWPFLRIDSMFHRPRTRPLPIFGPIGTEKCLEALLASAYKDLDLSKSHYAVTITEFRPGEEVEVLGAKVRGFKAEHMNPPEQPMCLRVTGKSGHICAFSGDTEVCPGLFGAADGADLLVAECSAMQPPAGRHITWEEWKVELANVKAKRVLLTHLNEDVRAQSPGLKGPAGIQLDFAEDGMIINL